MTDCTPLASTFTTEPPPSENTCAAPMARVPPLDCIVAPVKLIAMFHP
jgi:hypothetical protein